MDIFLKSLYLPLVTCHMFKANNLNDSTLYVYISISFIIFIIQNAVTVNEIILNFIIVTQFSLLVFLCLKVDYHQNYWLIFFLLLYLINHFTLPNVSQKFCIPHIDLLSLSLVFLNTFLINAFC